MNYYVYAWLDTRKPGKYMYGDLTLDFEPYYVGKGSGRRCKRLHSSQNSKKFNISSKIYEVTGENPKVIKLKENMNEEEAFMHESRYINLIGREPCGSLVNLCDGGAGTPRIEHTSSSNLKRSKSSKGVKKSKETIERMSKAQKGLKKSEDHKKRLWKNRSKIMEPEVKEKIRNTLKNRYNVDEPFTQEHRDKISKANSGSKHHMYGKEHTESTKALMSLKSKGNTRAKGKTGLKTVNYLNKLKKSGNLNEESFNAGRVQGVPLWSNLSKYVEKDKLINIGVIS